MCTLLYTLTHSKVSKISCKVSSDQSFPPTAFSFNPLTFLFLSSVSSILSLHLLFPDSSTTSSLSAPSPLLFSSPPPAGTSWSVWSARRPRCQGREGTPRSYRSDRTPRRAGREGRQRSARASGIPRTQRRECKSDFFSHNYSH